MIIEEKKAFVSVVPGLLCMRRAECMCERLGRVLRVACCRLVLTVRVYKRLCDSNKVTFPANSVVLLNCIVSNKEKQKKVNALFMTEMSCQLRKANFLL